MIDGLLRADLRGSADRDPFLIGLFWKAGPFERVFGAMVSVMENNKKVWKNVAAVVGLCTKPEVPLLEQDDRRIRRF